MSYNRPDRPEYNRPPYNRPSYPNRPRRGPQRFRRPVRPQWGFRRRQQRPFRRPPFQQDSICRIVRQILIANPQLAGPIQEALMRHGISCPGLPMGGSQFRSDRYGGYGYGGGGGNRMMTARSNYASCPCGPPQVLPAANEIIPNYYE